jgi:hypothetical protein
VAIDDTTASVLTGGLTRAQAGTLAGEQTGGYAITRGTLSSNSDYAIAFTGSTLTITPATLTVTANPQTKVYGTSDPSLTYGVTGLVDTTADGVTIDDTAATALSGHLARIAGETVSGGPYAITQGSLAAGNYAIHFTGSYERITPATPALTVSASGGSYTGAPIGAMATVTGANGRAAQSLEGVAPSLRYYAGSGTSGTELGSTAPSAVGTYTVVASFPGSADYAASQSSPTTFVIIPIATTIALESSSSTVAYGQSITFVATLSSSAGTPRGTVTFFDGASPLTTVAINGSGQATMSVASLAVGSHAITATYNGVAGLTGASSRATIELVLQAATAIVLVPSPVLQGKKALNAIELSAEIEPAAPGSGVPSGHVTFELVKKHGKKSQLKTLGTAVVNSGAATLKLKANVVLNQTLRIVYSGDPDFLANSATPPKLTKKSLV